LKYRSEIDGLRALAVIPVILFHAGFKSFSGGFVGVDVFFVISGYLITTVLIEDIENKRFSIVRFYERRARRILPALFLVLLCCIPFAWLWLTPRALNDFSNGILATTFFASNVLFWRQDPYFNAGAEENPLLHTWSLAVEEQYYLLFPVFLFVAWKFGRRRAVFWLILLFAVISLALSEWGWRYHATANFYLAPTRAWELFAGSITAFVVHQRGPKANNLLALLGLSAVVFAIFAYDEGTPFPSVYTLVPVLGVVLLVLYADRATYTGKLLSSNLLVGIGLISYSAYLWHQPLIVLWKSGAWQDSFDPLLIPPMTVALAYLSWRFVETPFRQRGKAKHFLAVAPSVFFMSMTVSALALMYFGDMRFSPSELQVLNQLKGGGDYVTKRSDELQLKEFNDPAKLKIFVIGDSYAQDLVNAIYEAGLDEDLDVSTYYIPVECGNLYVNRSLNEYRRPQDNFACEPSPYTRPDVVDRIEEANHVLVASAWNEWTSSLLSESVKNLIARYGNKFIVFNRKDFGVISERSFASTGIQGLLAERGLPETMSAVARDIADNLPRVTEFIDSQLLLCGSYSTCKNKTDLGLPISHDGAHLTPAGAKYFGELIQHSLVNTMN